MYRFAIHLISIFTLMALVPEPGFAKKMKKALGEDVIKDKEGDVQKAVKKYEDEMGKLVDDKNEEARRSAARTRCTSRRSRTTRSSSARSACPTGTCSTRSTRSPGCTPRQT